MLSEKLEKRLKKTYDCHSDVVLVSLLLILLNIVTLSTYWQPISYHAALSLTKLTDFNTAQKNNKKKKTKKKKMKFSFRTSSGNLIKSSEIDEILSKNKDHLKAFISIKFKSYPTFWSKTFLKSCAWSLVVVELIHFFPKFSFDLPWKYQKNLWLSYVSKKIKKVHWEEIR